MRKIFINGRFLTQKTTGVQRVAEEIVKQLDGLIDNKENQKIVILAPRNEQLKKLTLKNIVIKPKGYFHGHLWEQLCLPWIVKDNLLVNFCNTAPIFKKNQIVYIHDAAVLDAPNGFTKKFIIFYKIVFGFISLRSNTIITVSQFSKKRLCFYFPHMKHKLIVSYLGTEHIRFKQNTIDNESEKLFLQKNNLKYKDYYLAVGSANPNKNFCIIYDMLKEKNNKFKFVIVGGAKLKVFREEKIDDKSIVKLGYVNDQELIILYKNAKAFIFPSKYEGFGLPPLEAMTVGTPVIAAKSASIPEILKENALYFKYNNSLELLKNINKLAEDKNLEKSLTIKSKEYASEFSWLKATKKLYNIIEKFSN